MSQPNPKPGQVAVAPVVLQSLEEICRRASQEELWPELEERILRRVQAGFDKYGTFLQTMNGRDALQDAWEEACDLVMYLHQAKLEGLPVTMPLYNAEAALLGLTRLQKLRGKE